MDRKGIVRMEKKGKGGIGRVKGERERGRARTSLEREGEQVKARACTGVESERERERGMRQCFHEWLVHPFSNRPFPRFENGASSFYNSLFFSSCIK